MSEALTTLAGFVLGLVGAWLFWRFQVNTKPDIRISACILRGTDRADPAKAVYRIKVYNFGKRQVVNVQTHARIVKRVVDHQGERWPHVKEIPLRFQGAFPALGRRQHEHDPLRHLPPGVVLIIDGDTNIEQLLTEDRRLMLTLSATDAESNMSVVMRRAFSRDSISIGDFPIGPVLAPLKAAAARVDEPSASHR